MTATCPKYDSFMTAIMGCHMATGIKVKVDRFVRILDMDLKKDPIPRRFSTI